ncbi:MAG TPA: helix-hairpin-helix domain-containing protein [Puia sp.]|jgi:DNA uptake protein ComE-like DNA-binding protein
MWETIRGYLTFTRKERFGVLFLLILIFVFFVLPFFLKPSPGDPDPAAYLKLKEDIRKFETRSPDSSVKADSHDSYSAQNSISSTENSAGNKKNSVINMFYFDPNKIQAADWLSLGLPDRLARTITHYLEKGGRFKTAEDLRKMYGMSEGDYERLFPFVRIDHPSAELKSRTHFEKNSVHYFSTAKKTDSFFYKNNRYSETLYEHRAKDFQLTEINLADSSDWARLPGIGERLASRIIRFREKLGGFYQTDQVAETFGLPDSTFQKIKPYLRVHSVSLQQININTATKEILMSHPYIRWQLARQIIDYRMQHGSFQSVDDLLQLALMDQVKFEKLKPYLTLTK